MTMNWTLKELAAICRDNPLGEKLLFVPSHSMGHQIGQWLARSGVPWVNLRMVTPAEFAAELTFVERSGAGTRFIESDERLATVEEICRRNDVPARGTRYFDKASTVPGLVKALSNTLHELRMAGLHSTSIDPASFLVHEKGRELIELLAAYEFVLEERKLVDHAGLLDLATKTIADWRRRVERSVMVLSDYPVTFVERRLIQAAGGDSLIILSHDMPVGTVRPPSFFAAEEQGRGSGQETSTDCALLKWVLNPESAPAPRGDGTVSLFGALGESNEVREVFRRIMTAGIPADDVEIVISTTEPYAPLIRTVTTSLDVPVTFGPGIPLKMTRVGSAFIIYLKWQAEDFADKHLRHLLASGYMDLKEAGNEPPLSPRQAAAFLREAQIGWGRERYAARLAALEKSYGATAAEWRAEGEDEKALWAEETEEKVRWLWVWIERIIGQIPASDDSGTVERVAFYDNCRSFVEKYCRVTSELDGEARSRLVELLHSLQQGPSLHDSPTALLARLTDQIDEIAVGYSGPQPGAVHVADYRSAGWSGRRVTFVMGLDQARFPGALLQDPIILDDERQIVSPEMRTSADLMREKIYVMGKFLASARGPVTMSYPCRDLLDDREVTPSALVLNAYRLIARDPSADYSALLKYLGEPAGFRPESSSKSLNEWEWWLSLRNGGSYDLHSVLDCYPNLGQGVAAAQARSVDTMSVHDGHVPSAAGTMDPYDKKKVFSASQIENLAACPFRFFLTYLLHIEPLEDLEKDANQWLKGAPRGTLLHDVFRRFMGTITEKGERPAWGIHWEYLKDLATSEVEKWKEIIPPPSSFAYQSELREILQSCERFLRDEEERCRTIEPCFFELSFGLKVEDGQQAYDAVEIPIKGKGGFMLRGRIDRVDKCGDHSYQVWDYKTGSTYGYQESDYYKNGRQVQHVLYAMAAERILRQHHDRQASVVRGGYYFPGPKGEGLRIERDETRRAEALGILDELFSLLKTGVFPSAYDNDPCPFCLYSPACGGGDKAVGRCRALLAGPDELLEPLRRLIGND